MKLAAYNKCCGCGNCQAVCPRNAISVKYDYHGFLHPEVNTDKCIDCRACESKCPMLCDVSSFKNTFAIKTFYGCSREKEIVTNSSSGGIATAISKYMISINNAVVYGSEYKNDFQEVHTTCIHSIDELYRIQGSKYIQSLKKHAFNEIKEYIISGRKVIYIGLPCEIAALKLFLNGNFENLYCIDIICHGPTSSIALHDYLFTKSNGKISEINDFNMRFKKNDIWSTYYMYIELKNGKKHIEPFWTSDFGTVFSRYCNNSCLTCPYKSDNRFSDLTIGDAWGANDDIINKHKYGLSSIIVNTEKGMAMLKCSNIMLYDTELSNIVSGNPNIVFRREKSEDYDLISRNLANIGLVKTVKKIRSYRNRLRILVKKIIK